MSFSDDELVAQCLADDIDAGQEIYVRYALFLYRLAYRTTLDPSVAEDLCQETWFRIFRNLKSFQPGSSFQAWSGSICYRLCIDYLRKQKTYSTPDRRLVVERLHQEVPHPRKTAEFSEFLQQVRSLLHLLPVPARAVFHLRHFEHMNPREIATTLGCSEVTVRTRLFRAVRVLRQHLDIHESLDGVTP